MSHHPERTARNVRPVNQPPSIFYHNLAAIINNKINIIYNLLKLPPPAKTCNYRAPISQSKSFFRQLHLAYFAKIRPTTRSPFIQAQALSRHQHNRFAGKHHSWMTMYRPDYESLGQGRRRGCCHEKQLRRIAPLRNPKTHHTVRRHADINLADTLADYIEWSIFQYTVRRKNSAEFRHSPNDVHRLLRGVTTLIGKTTAQVD